MANLNHPCDVILRTFTDISASRRHVHFFLRHRTKQYLSDAELMNPILYLPYCVAQDMVIRGGGVPEGSTVNTI